MWGFRNRKADQDIEIIGTAEPEVCGGTSAYRDADAPKKILSREMTLFDASSSFVSLAIPGDACGERIWRLSAFAARSDRGSLVFMSKDTEPRQRAKGALAILRRDVMPDLAELVEETGLASRNGRHSFTHGLPEDFGGSVLAEYASGERISFSDNQTPVLGYGEATRIAELFGSFMEEERVPLEDLAGLREVRFTEERDDGFTRSALIIGENGSGVNRKSSRYGESEYESEKPVDAGTVAMIKDRIGSCGMLAWPGLPVTKSPFPRRKRLEFAFDGGATVSVEDGCALPRAIGGGFFDIELELTVKHRSRRPGVHAARILRNP